MSESLNFGPIRNFDYKNKAGQAIFGILLQNLDKFEAIAKQAYNDIMPSSEGHIAPKFKIDLIKNRDNITMSIFVKNKNLYYGWHEHGRYTIGTKLSRKLPGKARALHFFANGKEYITSEVHIPARPRNVKIDKAFDHVVDEIKIKIADILSEEK